MQKRNPNAGSNSQSPWAYGLGRPSEVQEWSIVCIWAVLFAVPDPSTHRIASRHRSTLALKNTLTKIDLDIRGAASLFDPLAKLGPLTFRQGGSCEPIIHSDQQNLARALR